MPHSCVLTQPSHWNPGTATFYALFLHIFSALAVFAVFVSIYTSHLDAALFAAAAGLSLLLPGDLLGN